MKRRVFLPHLVRLLPFDNLMRYHNGIGGDRKLRIYYHRGALCVSFECRPRVPMLTRASGSLDVALNVLIIVRKDRIPILV